DSKAVTRGTFKIKVAPSLCLPRPKQRFSAHLVSTNPIKWFFLYIRVFTVFHEKMHSILAKGITTAHDRRLVFDLLRNLAPVFEFPGHHICRRIVHIVPYVPSP